MTLAFHDDGARRWRQSARPKGIPAIDPNVKKPVEKKDDTESVVFYDSV
jgi:hypothetical protein